MARPGSRWLRPEAILKKNDNKGERFKEFLAEAEDILNSMGKGLLKLGKGVKAGVIDPNVLNSVFRSAHTLKGISGIFEFRDMTVLSHSLEDTLDMLRLGRLSLTKEVLGCIMNAHELLVRMTASKGQEDLSKEVRNIQEQLEKSRTARKQSISGQINKEVLSVLTEYEEHRLRENLKDNRNVYIITVKFPLTSFDKGYASLTGRLKEKAELVATLPSSRTGNDLIFFDMLIATTHDKESILEFIGGSAESEIRVLSEGSDKPPAVPEKPEAAAPAQAKETLRRTSNTVRVNIRKLDGIMNNISDLGLIRSSIGKLGMEMRSRKEFSVYALELSRIERLFERKVSELRDGLLDVRMVPIGQLFGRFDTFINKLSLETGKEVAMKTHGEETQLDKLIVEDIADPIMHIVRNMVDHAIEEPDLRQMLGKPRSGSISLSAYQKGNHVVIEVKDDGAGINPDAIKAKAVEKGLIAPEYAEGMSRQEALELIFLPGFSTKDSVSETSGRGVGMDVVKENITRISGVIDIETAEGKGTSFFLTIPITLAIIQALIVEESGRRYAIPLNSIVEIIELHPGLDGLVDQDMIFLNERAIPSVRLAWFFGYGTAGRGASYGVIAGLAEHRVCVLVEKLVSEQDVVIKPLSRLVNAQGIAGATDLGEEGTILVLDVTGILETVIRERKSLLKA